MHGKAQRRKKTKMKIKTKYRGTRRMLGCFATCLPNRAAKASCPPSHQQEGLPLPLLSGKLGQFSRIVL